MFNRRQFLRAAAGSACLSASRRRAYGFGQSPAGRPHRDCEGIGCRRSRGGGGQFSTRFLEPPTDFRPRESRWTAVVVRDGWAKACSGMAALKVQCRRSVPAKQVPAFPILIQCLKIGSPTRYSVGEQAPGGLAAREKPEGARRAPTRVYKRGSIPGVGTAKWCAPLS
jgi:hypothetical protein